jgi:hypothetical protein
MNGGEIDVLIGLGIYTLHELSTNLDQLRVTITDVRTKDLDEQQTKQNKKEVEKGGEGCKTQR